MGDFESKLLNFHVLLMAAGAWFILWGLRKVWAGLDKVSIIRKLKPIYAVVLCEILVQIPGVLPDATMGERVLTAIWAAFLSCVGYQLIRRFLKPSGIDLPEDPEELAIVETVVEKEVKKEVTHDDQ
jgi:predicted small integral membrane protein